LETPEPEINKCLQTQENKLGSRKQDRVGNKMGAGTAPELLKE